MARWREYVSVGRRRASADRLAASLAKRGEALSPVRPQTRGRQIAQSVWGLAWCANLERYRDYENRLPRGRTYVRNGSVIDLRIAAGAIDAQVMGSSLYRVKVRIEEVSQARWRTLARACTAEIGTLVELLDGRVSTSVMARMTAQTTGLFPEPREITLSCSCPDWATMCKHVAAVLYGVGVRLDAAPQLLFELRGVDPLQLVARAGVDAIVANATAGGLEGDLEDIFGIELERPTMHVERKRTAKSKTATAAAKPTKPTANAVPVRKSSSRGRASVAVITRAQLIARGVSSSAIASWYGRGLLESTGTAGTYRWTPDVERKIREYLERRLASAPIARRG